MRLQKLVFIGMIIALTGILALPAGSFACWGTGDYLLECCFVCCETLTDCENAYAPPSPDDPDGPAYNCSFNWYCVFNPGYCLRTCTHLGPIFPPDDPEEPFCPFGYALNNDPEKIEMLRRFRDEVLIKTPVGREYIKLYYRWGPVAVHIMKEDEELKEEVKALLEELLPLIEEILE